MTTTANKAVTKKIFSGIILTMMVLSFYSCAKKHTVAKTEKPAPTETLTPAAVAENKGQVQIKRDAGGNYVIQINLRELEEVSNTCQKNRN